MIVGKVTGNLWATRKCERLIGKRLVIVKREYSYDHYADHVGAVDDVGAEVGQRVLICMGAPGRWQAGDARTPINASVAAIVDALETHSS